MGHRLVLVEWEDAVGCGAGWQPTLDDSVEPCIVRSVGWILAQSDRAIYVVPTMYSANGNSGIDDAHGMGSLVIPRSTILRVVDLSEGTPSVQKKKTSVRRQRHV